ncbi:MAG: hypothetical protein HRU00_12190 [Myxococcales bacterium]|nr:hypothetical protein [Myxococcales bacterium]
MGKTGSSEIAVTLERAMAALPAYDPLAPRKQDQTFRSLFLISLLFHLALLVIFWDSFIGVLSEKEDPAVVKVLEPQVKIEPKVLKQRRIDTRVKNFKKIVQPEIKKHEIHKLDDLNRQELSEIEILEAPKFIEHREFAEVDVSIFAERPTVRRPISVPTTAPSVRRIQRSQANTGPREIRAASPENNPRAARIEGPVLTDGAISETVVDGANTGAKIAALRSGTSDQFMRGTGDRGLIGGVDKDCNQDPACLEYLDEIRRRVYARWHIPPDVTAGNVQLRFVIDRGGSAHRIELVQSDDRKLGTTCVGAFRAASPFRPPPAELQYIVGRKIRATFDYGK